MPLTLFSLCTLIFGCTITQEKFVSSDSSSREDFDLDHDGVGYEEGDCDDDNPNISPLLPDESIDGIDQNCDGLDGPDLDGDGLVAANAGGEDCNDLDPDSTTIIEDPDCDGYPAWIDCDDNDPNSTTTNEDSDCDGFVDQPCSSLSFDGVDDTLKIETLLDFNDITIELWVKPPLETQVGRILFESNLGWEKNMLSILITSECKLQAEIKFGGQNIRTLTDADPICGEGWSHIALVREGAEIRLFKHGTESKKISFSEGLFSFETPFIIGYTQTPHDLDAHYQGIIHSMSISSSALYASNFIPERQEVKTETVLLWYLSEGEGGIVNSEVGTYEGNIDGATWVEECPYIYQ